MAAKVDQEKCTVCGACVQACPVEAIRLDGQCAVIDKDACIDCGACLGECPAQAISLDS